LFAGVVVAGVSLFSFGFGVVGWWWRLLACGGPVFARWVGGWRQFSLVVAAGFVVACHGYAAWDAVPGSCWCWRPSSF